MLPETSGLPYARIVPMQAPARHAVVLVIFALAACGGGTPAPQGPAPSAQPPAAPTPVADVPESAPIDSGKDCAHATGKCGGGTCAVTIKNDCDQPIRCDLQMTATCETQNGTVAADGADRATIGAHESSDLGAQATCAGGPIVHTEVQKLACK
jgi:hypothetical protein